MVRLKFIPQEWVEEAHDTVIECAAEGEQIFEIPDEDLKCHFGCGQFSPRHITCSHLKLHDNAPKWVHNWDGPWNIEKVERSTRKFYKTTITYVVLSERPVDGMDLETLGAEAANGDMVGDEISSETVEIDAKTAAAELKSARSEPEFFRLDDDGYDIEDE